MVIVHGSGSSPDDWPLELQNAIDAGLPLDVRQCWDIVRYGWEEHANNQLLASNAGLESGQQVGMMLTAEDYEYSQIHFIAHGVGSFVAHAAATTYINTADQPATIHTTYPDPVSSRDILFGHGVDFSENYFNDVGLVIPVVLKGDPLPSNWLVDLVLPPLDRKMGFYVLNIPADDAVALAAGKEIWGFTKFVPDVDFHHSGSSIDMTLHDPNSNDTILNFVGDVGSGIAIPAMSSLTMSELNGVPMKTINYASGTAYTILNYQLLLTVGESQHPMAQNLRDIGVDGAAPTMLTVSTDYQSVLYFGEPM